MKSICRIIAIVVALVGTTIAGQASERIVVQDLNGARIAPIASADRKPTILIFITNDCPIANACAPEIERIYRTYAPKRAHMYLVYVDPSLSSAAARRHRKEFAYTCPGLLDPDHRLVRAAKATVTPEAALFGAAGRLLYHGPIDDRVAALGKVRPQPTRRDLRDAIDACLQGRRIKPPVSRAIGCAIADLERR